MVDHTYNSRHSLQNRLERSRRYRSRGRHQHDAASVGETSVNSLDIDSIASVSVPGGEQTSSVGALNPEHSKPELIKTASSEGEKASVNDIASVSQSSAVYLAEKPCSRLQRIMPRSLNKRVQQTPPVNTTTVDRSVNSSGTNLLSDLEVDRVQMENIKDSTNKDSRIVIPEPAKPEARDVDTHYPNRREYQSPKHQVASPHGSMLYQTSEMAKCGHSDFEDVSVGPQATKARAAYVSSTHVPSTLQTWQQREQRKRHDGGASPHALSDNKQRSNRVGVAPFSSTHVPSTLQSWQQRERHDVGTTPNALSDNRPRGNRVDIVPKKSSVTLTSTGQNSDRSEVLHAITGAYHHRVTSDSKLHLTASKFQNVNQKNVSQSFTTEVTKKTATSVYGSPLYTRQPPSSASPIQHHRHSTGGNTMSVSYENSPLPRPSDGNMYKNILKPVRRDREEKVNPTETIAFGGVIETPKSVKVANLRASFDSRQNQPIMPMNSTDPRVRHSIPLAAGANASGGQSIKMASPKDLKPSATLEQQQRQEQATKQVVVTRQVVVVPNNRDRLPASNKLLTQSQNNTLSTHGPEGQDSVLHGANPSPSRSNFRMVSPKEVEPVASSGQQQRQEQGPKHVAVIRQVVVVPNNRDPLPQSNKFSPESQQINLLSSHGHEGQNSVLHGANSSPPRPVLSFPSHDGVAERYRMVTGRTSQYHEPESVVEEGEVQKPQPKNRIQKYYKASWRVQTNGFEDETSHTRDAPEKTDSLSPRQTVLSTWNQRYQEQTNHTFLIGQKMESKANNQSELGHDKETLRTDENSEDPQMGLHNSHVSRRTESSQLENPIKATTKGQGQNERNEFHKRSTQEAVSVFSPWHQRAQQQQQESAEWEASKSSSASSWQQRSPQQEDVVDPSLRDPEKLNSPSFDAENVRQDDISFIQSGFISGKKDPVKRRNSIKNKGDAGENRMESDGNLPHKSAEDTVSTSRQQKGLQQDNQIASLNVDSDELSPMERMTLKEHGSKNYFLDAVTHNTPSSANQTHESDACEKKDPSVTAATKQDFHDPKTLSSAPLKFQQMKQTDRGPGPTTKPWEKDTRHSVVQSWQMRSSKAKESTAGDQTDQHGKLVPHYGPPVPVKLENEPKVETPQLGNTETNPEQKPQDITFMKQVQLADPRDFIDEKNSEDLSVNEDAILGLAANDDNLALVRDRADSSINLDEDGGHQVSGKKLSYDDDSYISGGDSGKGETVQEKSLPAVPRTGNRRSPEIEGGLEQIDSEELSLYVEDELTKRNHKTPTLQKEKQDTTDVIHEGVRASPMIPEESSTAKKNPLRINPSPRDNAKYRMGYFGDESPVAARVVHRKNNATVEEQPRKGNGTAVPTKRPKSDERAKDTSDIWAVSSGSEGEGDESIQFDETHEWLSRDPDIQDVADDEASISSEPNLFLAEETRPEPPVQKEEPKVSDVGTVIPILDNPNTWTPKDKKTKDSLHKGSRKDDQVVFDPFHDDDDEGLKEEVPNDLFSPTHDPFMTEESFSPLEWSSPRGTTAQNIGYYSSPDSRMEI